jgi:DNA (cytosine-5)-methyltransferase 1
VIRIGSLFSGYGGLDIAVQAVVGGELAWYSEIEPAACRILAAHHPDVPNIGDITTVDWTVVEPIDVLTGGYPCQPFSHAGNRKGKNDERHLWPYVAAAVDALRPGLVVLENVRGHLTLGFGDVLADLSRVGYDARWGVVRASDAGAPHGRARVFIAAYPHGEGLEGAGDRVDVGAGRRRAGGHAASRIDGTPADAVGERHDGIGASRPAVSEGSRGADAAGPADAPADSGSGSFAGTGAAGDGLCQPPQRGNLIARHAEGEAGRESGDSGSRSRVSGGTDRGTSPDAGNGEWEIDAGDDGIDGQRSTQRRGSVVAAGAGGSDVDYLGALARPHAATGEPATGHRRAPVDTDHGTQQQGVTGMGLPDALGRNDWGKYEPAIRRWERTLDRPAPDPTVPGANGRPRLSPLFVEWMMGLPLGHVTGHGLKNTQELKALGNGVVPAQAALALRMLGVS